MLLYILVLSFAVSMDAFAAGLTYGLRGIRVPPSSLAVVGIITTAGVGLGLFASQLVERFAAPTSVGIFGAALLVGIGVYRVMVDYLRGEQSTDAQDGISESRGIRFSIGELLIEIAAHPEAADLDLSYHISPGEAVLLGAALGMDNILAALAAALTTDFPVYTPLVMGGVQALCLALGVHGGQKCSRLQLRAGLHYLSGGVLIILGLIRLC